METVADKTALLFDRDAPIFRYQEVVVASVMISAARGSNKQNVSLAQLATLHVVQLRRHMRVGEIADALGMQLPGVSKLVGDLVSRGLCSRVDDPDDRRAKLVTVTEAGATFIDQMYHSYGSGLPGSLVEASADRRHFQPDLCRP